MEGRSTALTAATAGTAPIMKKKEKKKQKETSASSPSPIIVITRHGERADGDFPPPTGTTTGEDASVTTTAEQRSFPPPSKMTGWKHGDPSLTERAYDEARDVFVPKFIAQCTSATANSVAVSPSLLSVTIHVSPFLRTLQTAAAILEGFAQYNNNRRKQTTIPGTAAAAPRVVVRCVEIDPAVCEIFGPPTIKGSAVDGVGPKLQANPVGILLGRNDDDHNANSTADTTLLDDVMDASSITSSSSASLPVFGETAESAYARFRARFEEIADAAASSSASSSTSGGDVVAAVTLIVTHGDAINAVMTRLHPERIVYNVDFLASVYFTSTQQQQQPVGGDAQEDDDAAAVAEESKKKWKAEAASGVDWIS